MIYDNYKKINLNLRETCEVIGISYSKATKMFSQKGGLGDKQILKNNLFPKWKKIGKTKLWNIHEIVKWNDETVKVA